MDAAAVLNATRPEDIFGVVGSVSEARIEWRRLARDLHPDAGGDAAAFAHLSAMWAAAKASLESGTYGTSYARLAQPVTVRTRRRTFQLTQLAVKGDSTNVYHGTYAADDGPQDALIKIARSSADNDLIGNEGKTLKHLLSDVDTYDMIAPYLPDYLESFGYRAPGERKARQAIAFKAHPRFYTLQEVRQVYTNGVNAKDAAWMLRRLLMALGLTHSLGRIHGAVLPQHVLIQPDLHGLVLLDWKAAVEPGQKIPVISASSRAMYAPEVLDRAGASAATDIYMAMQCLMYVMGASTPEAVGPSGHPVRAFIQGSTQANPKRRPNDAFQLKDEYDDLIERLWGKRKFRPFTMPDIPTNQPRS